MSKEKIKVYLYTRVSTAMQIDGYSLEAQKTKMKAFCDYNEYEIAGEYEDAGKSGKSIEGRIAFNQMMDDIKSGKDAVSYVLVFKLSRFGRNAADVLATLQVMQDFGVNLICVEDGIDSSKDAGKLMFELSDEEVENLRSKFLTANISSKSRYNPRVFTEQGLYMLMTVLKGPLAVKQSKALIRTFKKMKDYILENRDLIGQRELLQLSMETANNKIAISKINHDMSSLEKQISDVAEGLKDVVTKSELADMMNSFVSEDDDKWLMFNAKFSSADEVFESIYRKAKSTIYVVDNYIGLRTLVHLKNTPAGVQSIIFSDNVGANKLHSIEFSDFCKEYPTVQIKMQMYNAKPYVRKYILERLENWNNREQIAVEEQIDDGTLTIEHIMPQTLTEEWKEALGMGWELTHTKYVDTLGNLTLSAYNSDYSNLSFLKKKNMPGKGFIHSKLQLNKYLKKLEKWDDEEFDFSNKRIIKMTLFGDEIATTDVTDAYKKIHSAVYDFDPAEYLRVINTVSDGGDIRCPYMVANGVYITTNISSQAKMANIQRLFEAFGFESKDLIFEVRDIPKALKFDISDEKTYCVLKVGELAKRLIGKALVDRRITEEEIALLHDKNYSKRLFPQNYYPVLADSVDAHRSKSKTTRYYKDPVIIDGREIFVSSQWFEDDRDNLLEWCRNHS